MQYKFLILIAIFVLSVSSFAQLPVLIDRAVLFENPSISDLKISPNGKWISFLKPFKKTQNIWIKRRNASFESAVPVTAQSKRPIDSYFWSRDSKYLLFVKDNEGDENYNVYVVNPIKKSAPNKLMPISRNLTKGKKIKAKIFRVPDNEPDSIYIGLNDRDPAWHDVYRISISSGEKTLVLANTNRLQNFLFDDNNKVRLSVRSAPNGDTEVLANDVKVPKVIYSCNVFEICLPIRLHKNNVSFYIQTNKGSRNLTQLILVDIKTGKEIFVEQDSNGRVDFGQAIFSEVSEKLIGTTYNEEKIQYVWRDPKFAKDYKLIKKQLPNRLIRFESSTADEQTWVVSASSDVEPGETYIFDRKERKLSIQFKSRPKIPRNALAEMKPISYKSSDGLEIPAYLTLPKGIAAKKLPLIVFPHGGPWQRDSWGYNAYVQLLANRGYAVLQMNFRGSTGYGKKFVNAANMQWGGLTQDDVTWGVKYLVKKGIVDSKRVGILGASFGGYTTLAGITFTPNTYSAAVAIVPISNFISLHDSFPAYWQRIRSIFYYRVGNPKNKDDKKRLEAQSPLNHVSKIRTPLMIVHGANDPRVNKRESDQIVIALHKRKYPVEYLVASDEGHGFRRPVNNMAMLASIERFLARHLGGRYQASMSTEVSKRLNEITVNPNDVKLSEKIDFTVTPKINMTGEWNAIGIAGGQKLPITLNFDQNASVFIGTITTPFGAGKILKGKIGGKKFKGTVKMMFRGQPLDLKMAGEIEKGEIKGSLAGSGVPPISFTGTKKSN